jgi:hypothetical protein
MSTVRVLNIEMGLVRSTWQFTPKSIVPPASTSVLKCAAVGQVVSVVCGPNLPTARGVDAEAEAAGPKVKKAHSSAVPATGRHLDIDDRVKLGRDRNLTLSKAERAAGLDLVRSRRLG